MTASCSFKLTFLLDMCAYFLSQVSFCVLLCIFSVASEVVSNGAINCLEKLISEMSCSVLSAVLAVVSSQMNA